MSSGHRTLTVFLSVITGLFLAIAGLYAHWPPWGWATAGAALAGGAYLAGRLSTPRDDPLARSYGPEPDVPVPPRENREQRVQDVALSSSEPDYDFLFSATIRWCPVETRPHAPPISPGGLAVGAALDWARHITAKLPPHRHSLAQHQLEGALGTMRPDPTGRLLVMAENITLALAAEDSERLNRLSTVRKDEALWEHERKWERSKRAYLGDDVLRDTGSAVVWWLARNDDQIKRTVDDIGVLAQLTSAANNRNVPDEFRHMAPYPGPVSAPSEPGLPHAEPPETDGAGPEAPPPDAADVADAADHFGEMLRSVGLRPGDDRGAFIAGETADMFVAFGYADEARRIRERFDTPPPGPAGESGDAGPGPAGDPAAPEGPEDAAA
ncbi:hypothetical protein [Streptomyces boncukensis]|uniref:Uncharacterized protein n=1 Tax=Streptomyces boncukensis TaxID=2711219 RepID=A0A6G4X301_9ACTN|nr:hypothetical protein [Streptomyces boncukensis]NGO71041.1 hypothetical protein [Streptomyces boncukensis]